MKKLLTLVFATLLGASLSFAQASSGTPAADAGTTKPAKTKGHSHHHKGKKGKKNADAATSSTTPAQK